MDEFPFGYDWKSESGKVKTRETYDLSSHAQVIAPTGSGKGVSIELPALLDGLRNTSILNPDPSAQNAAVCAAARRAMGHDVWCFNPKRLHVDRYPDLACMGFNPMDDLDPGNSAAFFMRAVAIAEALVPMSDGANGKFFDTSARGFATWLIMYVKLRDGDGAHLGTVRDLATEDEQTDDDGRLIKGTRYTAACAVAMGHPRLASMAGRYIKESRSNNDVIATFEAATRCLLDDDFRASLSKKNGINFARMTEGNPKTAFLIVPAGAELSFFAPVLRVIINCFFNTLYAQGGTGRPVVALISESAQIGKLDGLLSCYGQGRKYGIRLVQIWQDANQIREVFGRDGAGTVIANSGCVFAFNPGNDAETSEFLSRLAGEHLIAGLSANDDPLRPSDRNTIAPQRERLWPPERIRSLPPRHGLLWQAGRPQPKPVYCPPWWDLKACRRVARLDPYHPTLPPRQTGPRRRRWAVAAGVIVLLAAGWYFDALSLARQWAAPANAASTTRR